MEELDVLVQRAQTGDVAAYTEIVNRFQEMAYGYALAYLNDFDLAQDAAQEAFIEAYRFLNDLRQPPAFPAWFKRILFKHCDRLTRRKRPTLQSLETQVDLPAPTLPPDAILERRELAARIRAAIQALPLPQRMATTLFYINGYSQQEIAEFLEVPAQTVKSRLYASRQRLKERMMDMVEEELHNYSLPENFTRETVDKAVHMAAELNRNQEYTQAEKMLRDILARVPEHPAALKELNHALMHGQVYGHGRWEILPELVHHGQVILKTDQDDQTYKELAETLLAIPAIPQAVDFIEGWIVHRGPDLERQGMLAWARGCLGEYSTAEADWQKTLQLAAQAKPAEVCQRLGQACIALVDCFAAAKDMPRAQHTALQGWQVLDRAISRAGSRPFEVFPLIGAFFQAGLNGQEVAANLLGKYTNNDSLEEQGESLCIRAFLDDPEVVMGQWLEWTRECIQTKEWRWLNAFRLPIVGALRRQGASEVQLQLAQATYQLLRETPEEETANLREQWSWETHNFFTYFDSANWTALERVARQGIQEHGYDGHASGVIVARAAQGLPTPHDLIEVAAQNGVESIDSYGLFGWYMIAREAAAVNDQERAIDALRRSVGYWSNPPSLCLDLWENDARWGALREHPEVKQVFREKRQRIGAIYGQLHYFPGW